MGSLRFSHAGRGDRLLAPFAFEEGKRRGGGTAPPGPERAEKTRFWFEAQSGSN